MDVYFTGLERAARWFERGTVSLHAVNALCSYYRMYPLIEKNIHEFKSFMLDSGAYSFMTKRKMLPFDEWLKYADAYADFIIEHDVERYFELDIDSIIGYPSVRILRNRIENRTGRPSIPVWHSERGFDEYMSMVNNYSYVALGSLVKGSQKVEPLFPLFIKEAHARNCRIHALGYTQTRKLHKYHFDSADSTHWLFGGKNGNLFTFRNGNIYDNRISSGDYYVSDYNALNLHNLQEWMKFAKYAERNL